MTKRMIHIYFQTLAQLYPLKKEDFLDLKKFIQYKNAHIAQIRNRLLSIQLNQNISESDIERTEYGKPFLSKQSHLFFNHSHSQKHYVLATTCSARDIGVDIEDLDRKVRFEALAKHAFHPEEYRTWEMTGFDPLYWFKVWTSKEAVLKASGLGIRLSLNELNTHAHPVNDGGRCEHPLIGIFAYQNFNLGQAMLTVAWRSEDSCKGFAFPIIQINRLD